jgi:hypothetical protein
MDGANARETTTATERKPIRSPKIDMVRESSGGSRKVGLKILPEFFNLGGRFLLSKIAICCNNGSPTQVKIIVLMVPTFSESGQECGQTIDAYWL